MKRREKNGGREAYELLGGLVLAVSALVLVFLLAGRPFRVEGSSMEPTLLPHELMLVRSVGYTPRQGDMVVLLQSSFRQYPIVKRIIATGGQTVEIDYAAGTVTVDGVTLDEPYLNEPMERQGYQTIAELRVPEGCVFVMGDNRNHSDDSRDPDCGAVDERLVLGRVEAVLFPLDRARRIK